MTTATKPKVSSLLDLTEQLDQLGQLVEENEGELTPELEELLDQLIVQDKEKIGRIGWLIKDWDADADALYTRITELRGRMSMLKNKKVRLLTYIKYVMDLRGVSRLDGTPWNLRIQKYGGVLALKLRDGVEPKDLPKRFQRIEVEADTDALRAALATGPGKAAAKYAYIGERGSSVRVC